MAPLPREHLPLPPATDIRRPVQVSVFPLTGNFQTEIRRGYIGGWGEGGERALCTCSQVAGGNVVYGILSMENMRFSVWIRSDKEQVFERSVDSRSWRVSLAFPLSPMEIPPVSRGPGPVYPRVPILSHLLPAAFSLFILGFGVTRLAPFCPVLWIFGARFPAHGPDSCLS